MPEKGWQRRFDDPIPQCASAMLPPHEMGDSAGSYCPLGKPRKNPGPHGPYRLATLREATMLTKTDAEKGNRIVWRSPDTGEVRYGTITEIINNLEVVIAYDDGGMACAYVGNTFSNVRPA
jgi:hypothetical protein